MTEKTALVTMGFPGGDRYYSLPGISGDNHWWDNKISSLPNLRLAYPDSGGFIKPSSGAIGLYNDEFTSGRPDKMDCKIEYGDGFGTPALVLDLSCRVAAIGRKATTYNIFEHEFSENVLQDGVDENGNDVVRPLVFGSVTHMTPQRTGQTNQYKYYTPGVNTATMHVYDDGVDITGNVVNANSETFELNAQPVGEVTLSGTSTYADLQGVFTWGAGKLGVSLQATTAGNAPIDTVVTQQTLVVDFLNSIAGYCNHVFDFSADLQTLRLYARDQDNGTVTLTEFDFFQVPVTYPNPIKEIYADYTTREAVTDNTGHHLKDVNHHVAVTGNDDLGESIQVTAYNEDESLVEARLSELVASWSKPRGAITMPIGDVLPEIMQQVTVTDSQQATPITVTINVLAIEYNFASGTMTISGPGVVS